MQMMKPTNPKKLLANLFVVGMVALLMALAFCFGGCAARVKNVTNLPAGVTLTETQQWDTEVANLHKIADTVSALRQAVIGVRAAGGYPDDKAYAITLQALARIDQVELQAVAFLKSAPQTFGTGQKATIKFYVQTIAQELLTLNTAGVTGIKNPDSLKQVNALLTEVSSVASLVLSLTQ